MDLQLRALSEKCKQVFKNIEDIGDGSVLMVSENSKIRISKHDMDVAVEQFKLKYGIK